LEINIVLLKNDGMLYSVEHFYNAKKVITLKNGSCLICFAEKGACSIWNTLEQRFMKSAFLSKEEEVEESTLL
jgi:hypothetical protein